MVTKTGSPRRRSLWRKRAAYDIGKTHRQRQAQWQQQIKVLAALVGVTLVAAVIVIAANWQSAGSTKAVSCATYPQYCVPLVGGAVGSDEIVRAESAEARTLDRSSEGAAGVVRGYSAGNMPFIGDPDAPVHFRVVFDFSCSHCNDYHDADLEQLIENEVLKGRASLEAVILTGVGGEYSMTAAQAALCAGEQGAFWEMSDELFRLARSTSAQTAYTLPEIRRSADQMGLDRDELAQCVASNRYSVVLDQHQTFAFDQGATRTPTMVVSYGDSGTWITIAGEQRGYDDLKALIEAELAKQ